MLEIDFFPNAAQLTRGLNNTVPSLTVIWQTVNLQHH